MHHISIGKGDEKLQCFISEIFLLSINAYLLAVNLFLPPIQRSKSDTKFYIYTRK
jgi:hypothetical protein